MTIRNYGKRIPKKPSVQVLNYLAFTLGERGWCMHLEDDAECPAETGNRDFSREPDGPKCQKCIRAELDTLLRDWEGKH
jgi:hypothetical protein